MFTHPSLIIYGFAYVLFTVEYICEPVDAPPALFLLFNLFNHGTTHWCALCTYQNEFYCSALSLGILIAEPTHGLSNTPAHRHMGNPVRLAVPPRLQELGLALNAIGNSSPCTMNFI